MFFSYSSRPKGRTQPSQGHEESWYYFLALAQESTDVFWVLTPNGEMQKISPSWQDFTGQEESAYLGRGWFNALYPADQKQVQETLQQTALSGQTVEMDCHVCYIDGVYHLIHVHAIPVRVPPTEEVREVIMCGHDLTQPGYAGQMSAEHIQFAVNASQVGLWDMDLATNRVMWTDQEKALFGLPPSTHMTYERFLEAVHPDDRQHVLNLRAQSPSEAPKRGECFRTIWPDGSLHWLENRAQAIYDVQGRPVRLVGVTMDVTELKQMEQALRESEVRFRGLIESNIIGISVTDPHGRIYEANDALLSILGYTRQDLATGKMEWMSMTPPEYREESIRHMGDLLETGTMQPFEKEFVRKDGGRVPVLLGSTRFHQEGTSALFITFIVDITARKELERQKDLMLGITSHELKTPLAALKGTLQLIQRRLKRAMLQQNQIPVELGSFFTDLTERLESCTRQVDTQTHLINDLLDISRISAQTLKLELAMCDLVSIVRSAVENLRLATPERQIVLTLPEHSTFSVLADDTRIMQVITNYVNNAIRYSKPEHPIHVGLSPNKHTARVWVRDKGPGLTAEAQKEVWECFHQVKGVTAQSDTGKGLGLGLYICQKLIAQHQGEVGVESVPGEGSTFWFALPLAPS